MIDYTEKIPNNVDLGRDRVLQRALEHWQPAYMNWWDDMGPSESHALEVYLRTAISVEPDGWAQFGYVRMPEYRWGIFLQPRDANRQVNFGVHKGQPAWQDVPGEYRSTLRRMIVTQGDTEPASVEQQRLLGMCCPSLYDLRNIFQVNVEEGVIFGRWSICCIVILDATGAKRRRHCSTAVPAMPIIRAYWERSMSRRRIGWRFICSRSSPIATENSSYARWPNRASIPWRVLADSCSPRKRTICSWASLASAEFCSARAR